MSRGNPLTREAVLARALEIAERDGLDEVGYNGLARELGIRPQSMYRYVANIGELRALMVGSLLDDLVAEVARATEGLEPADVLRAYATALYDACHARPLYYEALTMMHRWGLVERMRSQLTALAGLTTDAFAALDPDSATAKRHQQLFMAVNLGYAQMSITEFLPESLRDDRASFAASVNEMIERFSNAS